jgi:signal transduction histidine kinase
MDDMAKTKEQLINELLQFRKLVYQEKNLRRKLHNAKKKLEIEISDHSTEKLVSNAKLQAAKDKLKVERSSRRIEREKAKVIIDNMWQEKSDRLRFFSIISHDLRSPIATLGGFLDLMLADFDQMEKSEIKKYILILNDTAVNLSHLTESLLSWTNAKIGKFECDLENILINDLINVNVELFRQNCENKNIKIQNKLRESISVYIDYDMINAVFRNLISNALKFTDKNGSIAISAELRKKEVLVSISDTGRGIDEEMLKHLFDPSIKTTTTGTEGEPGAGFGLLLCKELINKNEGTIWVDSESGVGTTVYFTLLRSSTENINLLNS